FLTASAPAAIYTLSLHDALPIYAPKQKENRRTVIVILVVSTPRSCFRLHGSVICYDDIQMPESPFKTIHGSVRPMRVAILVDRADRKSTRLNSSHLVISYAVFCL